MERYACIHGHFYQPPRENPWLEAIEMQDSADPYHDWNERITAECYEPNTASRILDQAGYIANIVNNYARISFNFGPTLMAWLADKEPDTYRAILAADRESQTRFSGHGSAIAQVYNHMIMPLANRRDKRTQIIWGLKDFEHRFQRAPEGMWLPETAVDGETLALLAEHGIRFTILAPHQARQIRALGESAWQDVSGGQIDPTRAYLCRLSAGRSITLFFYDGPISRAVAFEHLLASGERFASRLVGGFDEGRQWPQLMHIATDGETYGHHHRHGDMALAYALDYIERKGLARLTNYGEYLAAHPPTHEVKIYEDTAWSCAHGVERWRSDCGCSTGGHPDWNQAWRRPLREALDWLRDEMAPRFEALGRTIFPDPWAARDAYIDVILDRSPENVDRVLLTCAGRILTDEERVRALKLMELQRHAMLMYTSCGWFFDELSGIETVQVIEYAARAVQLAEELFGEPLEEPFVQRLEKAKSNIPAHRNGRRIWENLVLPASVDLPKVGAHYAVSAIFSDHPRTYSYDVEVCDLSRSEAGRATLVVGHTTVRSRITHEARELDFAVLHFGDHNLTGGVRQFTDPGAYKQMRQEVEQAFRRADFANVVRGIDRHFGAATYSLRSLFRDEQRAVLTQIVRSAINDAEAVYRHIYEDNAPLLRYFAHLGNPLPRALEMAASFVLSYDLRQAFEVDGRDLEEIEALLDEARTLGVQLNGPRLAYALQHRLERLASGFRHDPENLDRLDRFLGMVRISENFPTEVNLWECQNTVFEAGETTFPGMARRARHGDPEALEWVEKFRAVAEALRVRIPRHG